MYTMPVDNETLPEIQQLMPTKKCLFAYCIHFTEVLCTQYACSEPPWMYVHLS